MKFFSHLAGNVSNNFTADVEFNPKLCVGEGFRNAPSTSIASSFAITTSY